MINVNNLQLLPVKAQNGLTFFASFVLNDAFYLGNIAVYTRLNNSGFRCIYPSKELPNGTSIPLFHPINKTTGDYIETLVTREANQLLLAKGG